MAIHKIYQRKYLKEPCHLAMNFIKGKINKNKAIDMIVPMF